MYCPRCGQQQISEETRFCSRCGFLMTAVAELIAKGGALPQYLSSGEAKPLTPRRKGLKTGGFIFLSGFLIVPLLAIISIAIRVEPFAVAIAAVLTFVAGFLRMVYALIFESNDPNEAALEDNIYQTTQKLMNKKQQTKSLPPPQSVPAASYIPPAAANWRDTNDLDNVPSVTEHTTKHLKTDN
jgi:hypothetical protein